MRSKDTILNLLKKHRAEFERTFGVERIALFGSHVRNDHRPDSDIDILVSFKRPTFDHYMDLKFRLESLFGSTVDLVLEDSLKPRLRQHILSEAVHAEG